MLFRLLPMLFRPLSLIALSSLAAGQTQVQVLPPLAGHDACVLTDLADDGTAVGATHSSFPPGAHPRRAVAWHASGLPQSLGFDGLAFAISGDASTIVGNYSWFGENAFRLNATTGFQRLTFGTAYDVSYDGSVVVGTGAVLGPSGWSLGAYRWTSSTGAREIGGTRNAWGCSSDGAVVVGYVDGLVPFRWSVSGGLQSPLGTWVSGDPFRASADGSTVVGSTWPPPQRPHRWALSGDQPSPCRPVRRRARPSPSAEAASSSAGRPTRVVRSSGIVRARCRSRATGSSPAASTCRRRSTSRR